MQGDSPSTLGLEPSFGFGDRTGLATPGHVRAVERAGGPIRPIFAQQSIREMTRTGRSPKQVMGDALNGARAAGYRGPQGADADHLKTPDDVNRTAEAGFVFFTIDPSEHVDPSADNYSGDQLAQKYNTVASDSGWYPQYLNKSVKLSTGTTVELTEAACRRAAVKYGRAIGHAIELARHIDSVMRKRKQAYEIELSVDETPQPTTLAEHYIVADQCLKAGMKLVSLAPRFIGELEKGVDYKGKVAAFERSVREHAAVAKMLGPYKLSLHSGSDKLSIYPALARATGGLFHVKTAGTSYLEALRVAARCDPALFHDIVKFARSRYEKDRTTYHVSATLDDEPEWDDATNPWEPELWYLGSWSRTAEGEGFTEPRRQILHVTFGSVLTHPELKGRLFEVLRQNPAVYEEVLAEHFERHLKALRAGMA
jgi:tagaturonate epimerase